MLPAQIDLLIILGCVRGRYATEDIETVRRMTTMDDIRTAKIKSLRRNIQRYARLLATSCSDLEREYLRKRIAHEHTELERWEKYELESTSIVAPASTMPSCRTAKDTPAKLAKRKSPSLARRPTARQG